MKDFISSVAMVVLFQYINFKYLSLFNLRVLNGFEGESLILLVEANIQEYTHINYLGTLFSGAILLHTISKLIFNIAATIKLVPDQWTLIDAFSSIFNIFCFNYIGNV